MVWRERTCERRVNRPKGEGRKLRERPRSFWHQQNGSSPGDLPRSWRMKRPNPGLREEERTARGVDCRSSLQGEPDWTPVTPAVHLQPTGSSQ